MKRPTAIFSTVVTAAILFALTPGVAQAATVTAYESQPGPRSITVNTTAKIQKGGKAVQWRIRFTCPKAETYYVRLNISQVRAELPAPYTGGKPVTISATKILRGTCSGKTQRFSDNIAVAKTKITSPTGKTGTLLLPLRKTDAASLAQASLGTNVANDRGLPYYCSVVITPDEDGTSCEDYTLLGPNLRLR